MSIYYQVPGLKTVIAQPNTMACWATVFTMMRSWNEQKSYDIESAVEKVAHKYGDIYRNNTGLPSSEFGPFLSAAGMSYEPMSNPTVDGWQQRLQDYGLLWVGTMAAMSPNSGLHSRIIERIHGDESPDGTWFGIIDPAGGKQYEESITIFNAKYEAAFKSQSGTYYQIRHF